MSNNKSVFVEVHALQTVPPSCINRDDSGSPKSMVYGGVNRARVSSQAWKRAMRDYFRDQGVELGKRTLEVPALLAESLREKDPSLTEFDAAKKAMEAMKLLGDLQVDGRLKAPKGDAALVIPKLKALAFVSPFQITALTDVLLDDSLDNKERKKQALAAFDQHHGLDISLFGRMVANNKSLNVDGATQIAHAMGVTRTATEYDFYTALDDVKAAREDSDAGGAMMGVREFTEASLYRYGCVGFDELLRNLEGDEDAAVEGVTRFVEAFVRSMPTGSIRSYGNRTLPETVVVTVREGQPVNAAAAFRRPVEASEGEILKVATERLVEHIGQVEAMYEIPAKGSWTVRLGGETTLLQMLEAVAAELRS